MTRNSGGEVWSFTYGFDGLRTERSQTKNGTTTKWEYVYNGSQLVQMIKGADTLCFTYDAVGLPLTVTHKTGSSSTTYYYLTNAQGDIVAIIDSTGTDVATYSYDAWGNPLSTPTGTIATLNPLRYRGYIWDAETELYYLQSRYYSPELGRFISPDVTGVLTLTPMSLTDKNLFAYCDNNPVMRIDVGGQFWGSLIRAAAGAVVGAVVGAVAELTSQVVNYVATGEKIDWGAVGTRAASGAAYGGTLALTGSTRLAETAAAATESAINGIRNGDSVGEIAVDMVVSGAKACFLDECASKIKKKMPLRNLDVDVEKLTTRELAKYVAESYYDGARWDIAKDALISFVKHLKLRAESP